MLRMASAMTCMRSLCARHVNLAVFLGYEGRRWISFTTSFRQRYNSPLSPVDMPRAGGIATMMRLPIQTTSEGLGACFVGVPLDCGASHKPGARLAPRHIRMESVTIKPYNTATGAIPFESMQVADIGDIKCNVYELQKACQDIKLAFAKLIQNGCIPLVLGGDHTISYPILQAVKEKYGPVGLIHLDAHPDTMDEAFGAKIFHSTPIRRAVEDGCLDCKRVIQIGLRGAAMAPEDFDWGRQQGFQVIEAKDCWNKSMSPVMSEVRDMMGDRPVYISFDIDALDPSYAPGTGVPEVAGLTPMQALEIIRGCKGLNIVGGDLVEVSPPYDPTSITAVAAAYFLFEMLCILPGVKYLE